MFVSNSIDKLSNLHIVARFISIVNKKDFFAILGPFTAKPRDAAASWQQDDHAEKKLCQISSTFGLSFLIFGFGAKKTKIKKESPNMDEI